MVNDFSANCSLKTSENSLLREKKKIHQEIGKNCHQHLKNSGNKLKLAAIERMLILVGEGEKNPGDSQSHEFCAFLTCPSPIPCAVAPEELKKRKPMFTVKVDNVAAIGENNLISREFSLMDISGGCLQDPTCLIVCI